MCMQFYPLPCAGLAGTIIKATKCMSAQENISDFLNLSDFFVKFLQFSELLFRGFEASFDI